MRRAHYLVICGIATTACAAYLLGSGGTRGERATGDWLAPVGAEGRAGVKAGVRPAPAGPDARLLARLLEERYGLPEPVVTQALRESEFPEVLLAVNTAARTGRPFGEILRRRQAGDGWDVIARRLGLDAAMLSDPVLPPLTEADEALFRDLLGREYRVPAVAMARLRREGFAAGEILIAAALAGGGEAEVAETLYARRHGQPWQAAASRFLGRRDARATPGERRPAPDGGQARGERADGGEGAEYCKALLTGYYGVRAQDVEAGARRGLPWMDLLIAGNAAARSGRPFAQVVGLRADGLAWRVVEQRLGLGAGEALQLPAPSVRRAAQAPANGATARP